ncbi:MAG TPA: helix-hairpin-helix domain-containing protein [Acidimicrobiales bacterium]|nr:helix-hairpin-helix domain-containing protein [Acidimicrobiales bacterium]
MPDLPPPQPATPWLARLQSAADAAGVERRHIAVGAVSFVVLVIVVGAVVLGAGRSAAHPQVTLPRAHPGAAPGTTRPGAGAGATDQPSDERPVVAAAGAVVSPGLYKLPAGARVADVLNAAGGPTPDADVDQLNLALKVSDGDRVYVPRRGEAPPPSAGVGSGAGGASADAPVNLNSATLEQLDALPGVGPATAQAILDYRKQHGRFRSVDDLLEVGGIGPSKLEKLRQRVKV